MSQIKLVHSGGNGVIISAPSSNPAANRTITLPGNADGEMLTTTNPKTGNIIQVVQSVKKDTASVSGGIASELTGFESVSGLTQAITPSSTSNKILVEMNLSISISVNSNLILARLRRKIASGSFATVSDAIGDTAGSRYSCTATDFAGASGYSLKTLTLRYLDSPSTTSAVTYGFSVAHDSGATRTIYINRGDNDTSSYAYVPRTISTITLSEVAG
mgnify:CR=1 FL=1